jgi:hypothetical protein
MTSAGTQKFQKFLLARRWAPTKIRQFLQVLTRAKYSERLFPGYVQAERGWMQNRMRVQVAKMVAGSLLVSEVTNYALSRGKRHCWDNGFEHIFDVYLGQDDKGQPRFASAFVGRQAEEMRKLLGIGVSGVRAFFEEGGGLQDRTKTGVEALGGEGLKYLWGKVHPVPRGAAQEAVEAVWTKKINLNRIMRNILPAGVSQVERVVGGKFTISEGLQSWLGAWPTKGQAVGAGEIRVETQRHNRAMQFVKDHYGKANKLNGSAVKWNEIDWSKMPRNAATEKAVKTVIESNERIAMERERRAFAIQYKLEDREVPRKPFASEAEMIRFLKAHGRKP